MLISELAKDMRFEGFLLVRSAEQRVSNANGSRYLDMTLCDRSGEVNAKVWDGLAAPPASGSVIKVRALMQEYNGRLQMRVEKMRAAKEDEYDVKELVRCAPEDPQRRVSVRLAAVARMCCAHGCRACRGFRLRLFSDGGHPGPE